MKLAQEKGRKSKDKFQKEDKVVIQDHKSGKWIQKGTISRMRKADDGSVQSYTIIMNGNGNEVLRNKRFIKHDVWISKPKRVHFLDQADEEVMTGPAHNLRARVA